MSELQKQLLEIILKSNLEIKKVELNSLRGMISDPQLYPVAYVKIVTCRDAIREIERQLKALTDQTTNPMQKP